MSVRVSLLKHLGARSVVYAKSLGLYLESSEGGEGVVNDVRGISVGLGWTSVLKQVQRIQ